MLEAIGFIAICVVVVLLFIQYITKKSNDEHKIQQEFIFYKEHSWTFKLAVDGKDDSHPTLMKRRLDELKNLPEVKAEVEHSVQKKKESRLRDDKNDIFKFQNLNLLDKIFEKDQLDLSDQDLHSRVAKVFASETLIKEFIDNLKKHWCLFKIKGGNKILIGYISHPEKNAMITFDEYKKLDDKEEWYKSTLISRKVPERFR